MFQCFPNYGLPYKIILNFDGKFHGSNIMRCLHNNIHTGENLRNKSINTGEKPYINDVVFVSFMKTPVHKTYHLSSQLIKLTILLSKTLYHKDIAYSFFRYSL